ncbi:MAG: molybdopterin-binding protein [Deltaproteobacteria bacterium]|nr:molybdopterin-binding protein [Deltaproteobacteria bacterium]
MKSVPVAEAVGMVLCHDITRIIPNKFKGPAFKKGHVIREEDIEELRDLGKEHIYVWDLQEGMLHENDAAGCIAKAAAGYGITLSEPREGKVELSAMHAGLLSINIQALNQINSIDQIMFATIHGNHAVEQHKVVGGTRIIPLAIEQNAVDQVVDICQLHKPLIEVIPFKAHKIGVVTTGTEVHEGRIQDKFGPIIAKKFEALGSRVMRQIIVPDDQNKISEAIRKLLDNGADFIATTGGMSVDPDDLTPAGIRAAGGEILTYGAPVLPGAMFLLAHIGTVPVVGLPGCVMYHRTTVFDLIVPRLLAGQTITRKDIAAMGHGGLCANCEECRYPDCGFGK